MTNTNTGTKMAHYSIVDNFDVWGNEEDGYTVNESCVWAASFTIPEDATDAEIITGLHNVGFLLFDDVNRYEVHDMGDSIDVNWGVDGYPLCTLYLKQ